MDIMFQTDDSLVQKWEPVLEGIGNEYTRRVTAQLLENQAKSIVQERLSEAISSAATTTGQLGVFQKFAFPLVRRVYPDLLANKIVGVQPMQGPVSQVFYIGSTRAKNGGTLSSDRQTVYSKFNLTYRGNVAQPIGSMRHDAINNTTGTGTFATTEQGLFRNAAGAFSFSGPGLDGDFAVNGFNLSSVLNTLSGSTQMVGAGAPSGTMGGQIAAWPNSSVTYGFSISGGERLDGTQIPEMTFHIEQEAVVANTRKMRALWTLEASQDLKAYHNLDLERELTELLSKELQLEIDRELIEDIRMIAYGLFNHVAGGIDQRIMDSDYINMGGFPGMTNAAAVQQFVPAQFTYDFTGGGTEIGSQTQGSNIFVIDFTAQPLGLSPRHVGEVYANLLAIINLASQDI